MNIVLHDGMAVTLYPQVATWGALREFVRLADALNISDDTELPCISDQHGEFECMVIGPGDAS